MSDYSVTIQGVEDLLAKIDPIRDARYLQGAMNTIGVELSSKAKAYQPAPAESTYQRTMKLRNSWTFEVSKDNDAVQIGSSTDAVPYNRYVMDREFQTHVHAWHGWKTIQGILQMNQSRITEIMRGFLKMALNGK